MTWRLVKTHLPRIATLSSIIFLLVAELQASTRIVFLGDSLTAGYQLDPNSAFPALLGDQLSQRGHKVEVINAGISGETSAGGLRRIDWLLRRPVDILVLGLGANDALRGHDPQQTRANLAAIIGKTRAANPNGKILLAGMLAPPNMGPRYAAEFAALYPALAREHAVLLFPFLLQDVAGIAAYNLADGIHPNPDGHRRIAANLLPLLLDLLSAIDD